MTKQGRVSRRACLFLALWCCSFACGRSHLTAQDKDDVEICSAVILAACTGSPDAPREQIVYVVKWTKDHVEDDLVPPPPTRMISPEAQREISRRLSHRGLDIRWIEDFLDVKRGFGGNVEGGGSTVVVGEVRRVASGKVNVPFNHHLMDLNGFGGTYVLERRGDGWTVTGMTGPIRVS